MGKSIQNVIIVKKGNQYNVYNTLTTACKDLGIKYNTIKAYQFPFEYHVKKGMQLEILTFFKKEIKRNI